MRDPESQTPDTSPGLQALSHYNGSPSLEPVPVPEIKWSQNTKQAPDKGISAQKIPRKVRGIEDTKWEVPSSPRASTPGAARPGPPRPGLLDPGLHARGCSLWLTMPEAVLVPERWAHTNKDTRQALGSLLRHPRGRSEG